MKELAGSRLAIARMRRGMTQKELAEKCSCEAAHISQLESGVRQPSTDLLDKLIFILGFPKKYFQGNELETIPTEAVSFRSRASRMSKAVRDMAIAMLTLASEIVSVDLGQRFTLPKVQIPDLSMYEPEDAASVLRSLWNLGTEPLGNTIHLLESKGIEVYWLNEESLHLDGLSLWRDRKPYIALNSSKGAGDRSRFDACHELAHLVLHHHTTDLTTAEIEKQANRFASAFLLPATAFRDECPDTPDFRKLYQLKARWGVSIQAMIYRGGDLGIYSEWQKRTAFKQLNIIGARKREDGNFEPEESKLHYLIFNALKESGMSPQEYSLSHLGIDYPTLSELMPVATHYAPERPKNLVISTSNTSGKTMRLV